MTCSPNHEGKALPVLTRPPLDQIGWRIASFLISAGLLGFLGIFIASTGAIVFGSAWIFRAGLIVFALGIGVPFYLIFIRGIGAKRTAESHQEVHD